MKYKVSDSLNRIGLIEGRVQGIGMAFCQLIGDTLNTIQPVSACKDYLNDVVWSEATGKPFYVYGLHTKKRGIFDGGRAYLLAKVCKYRTHEMDYPSWGGEVKALEKNHLNMQALVNWFEEKFEVDGRTEAYLSGPNQVVFDIPLFWVKYTYLISFFGLVARMAVDYDGKEDAMKFLGSVSGEDAYMWKAIKSKAERMIKGEFPVQDLSKLENPHDIGIQSFPFPS